MFAEFGFYRIGMKGLTIFQLAVKKVEKYTKDDLPGIIAWLFRSPAEI
ncbi:MAG: hypothetical protein LZF85_01715 [Nitrosomonas sp.]|nr:hypothetical protein [Nitrosomonas sp.]UJP03202.1 MAG: hypothetical protein LZF85_01715 [Nitrosomonas sp.]